MIKGNEMNKAYFITIFLILILASTVFGDEIDNYINNLDLGAVQAPDVIAKNYEDIERNGVNLSANMIAGCVIELSSKFGNDNTIISRCVDAVEKYKPTISNSTQVLIRKVKSFKNTEEIKEFLKTKLREVSPTRITETKQREKLAKENINSLSQDYNLIIMNLTTSKNELDNCIKNCELFENRYLSNIKDLTSNRINILKSTLENFKLKLIVNRNVAEEDLQKIVEDVNLEINFLNLELKNITNSKNDIQVKAKEILRHIKFYEYRLNMYESWILISTTENIVEQMRFLGQMINESSHNLSNLELNNNVATYLNYVDEIKNNTIESKKIINNLRTRKIETIQDVNYYIELLKDLKIKYRLNIEKILTTQQEYKLIKADILSKTRKLFVGDDYE